MKFNKIVSLSLPVLLILAGCSKSAASSSSTASTSSSQDSSSSLDSSSSSAKEAIQIDAYGSAVSDTAAVMIAGKSEGTNVDYVVSSQPVVFAAMAKNKNLTIKADIAKAFSEKFGTNGFPQAGLFIKKTLSDDTTKKGDIESFLKSYDTDVADLIAGGTATAALMDTFGDATAQKGRFGTHSTVLKAVQKTNGLSFLSKEKNPDVAGFAKFKDPLKIDVQAANLSSYYSESLPEATTAMDSLSFSVASPIGAPSVAFARYASDTENYVTEAPTAVSAEFASGTKDFIVFDSVNGLALSKKNSGNYLLVRMVTFGNLYLVATGNDTDGTFSNDDFIYGFGENKVPDLAFKAVYGA